MATEIIVKIKEVIQRTYNVKSIRLEIPDTFKFEAGQFISVTLDENPLLKRYLSISNSPTESAYLEFTKKLTNSDFSQKLNLLKSGDQLKIAGPLGRFVLDPAAPKIAFLSGGIGITPIRSICKYVVDKNLGNDLALIYANRTAADLVFKDDFQEMVRGYPAFKMVQIFSEPEPGFSGRVGRINAEIVKQELPDYQERRFYLCGPPPMVEAMRKMLVEELNLAKDKIITENFQGY